jgi:hypothetical protein
VLIIRQSAVERRPDLGKIQLNKSMLTFALILSSAITVSGKKPPKPPAPFLCSIKTIFIDGNNPSATALRKNWQKLTGISVVGTAAEADAVLSVTHESGLTDMTGWNRKVLPEVKTSVLLTNKTGSQLWSATESSFAGGLMPSQQDERYSTKHVMLRFNKEAACGK